MYTWGLFLNWDRCTGEYSNWSSLQDWNDSVRVGHLSLLWDWHVDCSHRISSASRYFLAHVCYPRRKRTYFRDARPIVIRLDCRLWTKHPIWEFLISKCAWTGSFAYFLLSPQFQKTKSAASTPPKVVMKTIINGISSVVATLDKQVY